jgi:hypothetical protein
VTLPLVCQILADAADLDGALELFGRNFIPLAAILMPAGFFFSMIGRGVTRPTRFVFLLYAGAACLALGVASLGIGLLTSG